MKIQDLKISERILLAEKLWESVISEQTEIEIPDHQIRELDKRLQAYAKNQEIGSPWSEVKNRIVGNQWNML